MAGKHSSQEADNAGEFFKKKKKHNDKEINNEYSLERYNYEKTKDGKNVLENSGNNDKMDAQNIENIETSQNVQQIITQQQQLLQTNMAPNSFKTELYNTMDKGPYNLMMEGADIDGFEIGMKLKKLGIKDIHIIEKIARNKIRIQCKNKTCANDIIKKSDYEDLKKYKIYIPHNYVTSIGIVRNIPIYLSESEIRSNINSETLVTEVSRLTYYNKEEKISKPSQTIKITFRASTVPDHVIICHMKCNVNFFIDKPLFCTNCLSYGHFKKYCKTETIICKICTKITHENENSCKPYCKHCKDQNINSHKTADIICPEYKQQCDIREVMTKKKITFFEAKDFIKKNNILNKHNKNINSGNTYAEIIKQSANNELKKNENQLQNLIETVNTQKKIIEEIQKIMQNIHASNNVPFRNDDALIKITELLLINNVQLSNQKQQK